MAIQKRQLANIVGSEQEERRLCWTRMGVAGSVLCGGRKSGGCWEWLWGGVKSYNFGLDGFENFWVFIFMNNLLHQNNLGKYMLYKEHRPSILCVLRYIAHPFKVTRLQRPVLIQLLFVEDKFFKPLKNKREMIDVIIIVKTTTFSAKYKRHGCVVWCVHAHPTHMYFRTACALSIHPLPRAHFRQI